MSLESMFSLAPKKALVAGASRGIGLAIAKAFAAAGARTILASRSLEKLEAEAAALREQGLDAEAAFLDVTQTSGIAELADAHPDIEILANVAGTNQRKKFEDYTDEEYDRILAVNLHGLARVTKHVGRNMIARGKGGKIVTIGSLTSTLGLPYLSIYGISKSALAGLTRGLAVEWAPYNIQVNCIAPGFILTDMNRDMWQPEHMHEWIKGVQSNPRLGTPEDIAGLATFLAGPAAEYITGQVIASDGGYTTTARWPHAL